MALTRAQLFPQDDSVVSSETERQKTCRHDQFDQDSGANQDRSPTPFGQRSHSSEEKETIVCSRCSTAFSDDSQLDIVTWDGTRDVTKPSNWTNVRKWSIVVISSLMTFVVSFGSSVFASVVGQTAAEFQASKTLMLLGITLYVAGFALGPMIWGPASELYGRTAPLWFGMILFCVMQVPLAVAQNLQTIFIVRFFAGVFGSAPLAILGGMYVDFLRPTDLGIAVSIFSAGVFCGPALGPVFGTIITQSSLGWRWTAWVTLIMGVVLGVACFCITPETFEPVLLRRKAAKLRIETRHFAFHAKCEEKATDFATFITKYLTKPMRMIFSEPILIILTVYCSLVYGILYLLLPAFPFAFSGIRGWSPVIATLPFLALLGGVFLACIIIAVFSVRYVGRRYLVAKKLNPEDRLPPMIMGSFILPVGLFWFAWTSDVAIPWPAQVFSGVLIGCGIILIFMSAVVYLVDVYLVHANSALAISTFIRSLIAAAFPLFTNSMFTALGLKWGLSLLGFVCIALVPFPILFWKYGQRIRSWSKFSM